ncbi:hypothetical protein ACFRAE_12535 [Sphingobacterium sp. HJSM2_6]|uniref:hypothetical protein n=1 Tax=Sphingobacterium sp. HJSM2_6 TaxID=3366264 RepID=UPI003BEDA44F
MKSIRVILLFLSFCSLAAHAQTSLTAGPPRVYFVVESGQDQTQYIDVVNPSKEYPLELAVSFEDWSYSEYGENLLFKKGTLETSCANWISVSEPFFSLKPKESKRLLVNLRVPSNLNASDTIPVHTTMLFITQTNPRPGVNQQGANIRLSVRSGIKIYHRFSGRIQQDLEITDLSYKAMDSVHNVLEVDYKISGNVWMEGKIRTEFVNQETGEKTTSADVGFYCLPGDLRKQYIPIQQGLVSGKYLASVIFLYGEQESVKIAELEFDHDPKS